MLRHQEIHILREFPGGIIASHPVINCCASCGEAEASPELLAPGADGKATKGTLSCAQPAVSAGKSLQLDSCNSSREKSRRAAGTRGRMGAFTHRSSPRAASPRMCWGALGAHPAAEGPVLGSSSSAPGAGTGFRDVQISVWTPYPFLPRSWASPAAANLASLGVWQPWLGPTQPIFPSRSGEKNERRS